MAKISTKLELKHVFDAVQHVQGDYPTFKINKQTPQAWYNVLYQIKATKEQLEWAVIQHAKEGNEYPPNVGAIVKAIKQKREEVAIKRRNDKRKQEQDEADRRARQLRNEPPEQRMERARYLRDLCKAKGLDIEWTKTLEEIAGVRK